MPRRLIAATTRAAHFVTRCRTALRYMHKLNYSWRLAWAKAAR